MQYGKDIIATQDEKYAFVINVASGQANFTDILSWVQKHLTDR